MGKPCRSPESSYPMLSAGVTGGSSVNAAAAGAGVAPPLATAGVPPPLLATRPEGPAVSPYWELAASWAALRARTSLVRMPRSSWTSASRNRDASQRMM